MIILFHCFFFFRKISKNPSEQMSTRSTEPSVPYCSLDCGPGGNCYVEPQSYGVIDDLDESDDTSINEIDDLQRELQEDDEEDDDEEEDEEEDDDDEEDDEEEAEEEGKLRKRRSHLDYERFDSEAAGQRCQCPLGRGGDRCQRGKSVLLYKSLYA